MSQQGSSDEDWPTLARRAIGGHLSGQRSLPAAATAAAPAGVFVTLRTWEGGLRGCVGSVHPTQPDLAAEVARSAVLAATRDPRFEPVTVSELTELHIEVTVLGAPEVIAGIEALDPDAFGVIVRGPRGQQGLLLPGIVGIDDAATQVAVARRKAGIRTDEPVQLSRFRVRKYLELVPPARDP